MKHYPWGPLKAIAAAFLLLLTTYQTSLAQNSTPPWFAKWVTLTSKDLWNTLTDGERAKDTDPTSQTDSLPNTQPESAQLINSWWRGPDMNNPTLEDIENCTSSLDSSHQHFLNLMRPAVQKILVEIDPLYDFNIDGKYTSIKFTEGDIIVNDSIALSKIRLYNINHRFPSEDISRIESALRAYWQDRVRLTFMLTRALKNENISYEQYDLYSRNYRNIYNELKPWQKTFTSLLMPLATTRDLIWYSFNSFEQRCARLVLWDEADITPRWGKIAVWNPNNWDPKEK